jgi:hypothetical protein
VTLGWIEVVIKGSRGNGINGSMDQVIEGSRDGGREGGTNADCCHGLHEDNSFLVIYLIQSTSVVFFSVSLKLISIIMDPSPL